jgi:DNA-binding NtrC family response regulator
MALENPIRFQRVVEEKNHIKNLSKRIEQENVYLKKKIYSDFVIDRSPKMREVLDLVYKLAPTSTIVIV